MQDLRQLQWQLHLPLIPLSEEKRYHMETIDRHFCPSNINDSNNNSDDNNGYSNVVIDLTRF